jgi:dihydrofolate reductase
MAGASPARALKLFIAASLDGYIARPDGAVDWLWVDDDYGYAELYDSVDVLLMGRRTYEQVLTFGGDYPWRGKRSLVLSRAQAGRQESHASFVDTAPAALLAELRREPGGHIWLVGGAALVASFLEADLVDEIILSLHPILLGAGIPLFPGATAERALQLLAVRSWPRGLVRLHYRRDRSAVCE